MKFYIKHHHTGTGTVPYRTVAKLCNVLINVRNQVLEPVPVLQVRYCIGTVHVLVQVRYGTGTAPVQGRILCKKYCVEYGTVRYFLKM